MLSWGKSEVLSLLFRSPPRRTTVSAVFPESSSLQVIVPLSSLLLRLAVVASRSLNLTSRSPNFCFSASNFDATVSLLSLDRIQNLNYFTKAS